MSLFSRKRNHFDNSKGTSEPVSLFFERIEPKILLSADALAGLVANDPLHDRVDGHASLDLLTSSALLSADNGLAESIESGDQVLANFLADSSEGIDTGNPAEKLVDGLNDLLPAAEHNPEQRIEIIFIDAATPDYQQILDGIDTQDANTRYEIFILGASSSGVEQITRIVAGYSEVSAIHLISHGNEQGLQLGDSWLSNQTLDGFEESIAQWSSSLEQQADVLIYGCNLAAAEAGQELISSLAHLTGADIAASDDLTGSARLGGDWQLEYQLGEIDYQLSFTASFQHNWSHVLGKISVTTFNDVLDSDADLTSLAALALNPGSDGFVSVREAIIAANNDKGFDEVVLGGGTYTLSITGAAEDAGISGDLDVTDKDLIVRGDSAASTIIDGAAINETVFQIDATGVAISDLSISNGGSASSLGGGIHVNSSRDVTLTNVTLNGNQGLSGGAIYNLGGIVTLDQVRLIGNSADYGGAIDNLTGGTISGVDVEFSSNTATVSGGAIYNVDGISLSRVLFYKNSALAGGAILNEGVKDGIIVLSNATFSANTAKDGGGAIDNTVSTPNAAPVLKITDSTFTGNFTDKGANGIFQSTGATLSIKSSIFNDGGSNISGGTINSLGDNIDNDGSAGLSGSNDQVGDPQLDVLADNGGFVQTHALLAGSIAIDATVAAAGTAVDQRGFVRDSSPDIGAYEYGIPVLVNNNLTISQAEVVVIDTSVLSASDTNSDDTALVFNIASVTQGFFAKAADLTTAVNSFTQSEVTAGDIRFVHDGGEIAPAYTISINDGISDTAAVAGKVNFTGTAEGLLWLSLIGNEGTGSGIAGLDTTDLGKDDVLQMANPGFSLGEAGSAGTDGVDGTQGTFSVAFEASNFGATENINALHYVTSSITIGTGNPISLQPGDLILSNEMSATYISNGKIPQADLSVTKSDVFFFRPDTAGDYSTGNFFMLMSDPFQNGQDIRALTLIEKDIAYSDTTVHAGDFMFSRSGGGQVSTIFWMETATLNPTDGASYPAIKEFISGWEVGVDIEDQIYGLDVLEVDKVIGGQTYSKGVILISIDNDDTNGMGTTDLLINKQDIVALTVAKTSVGSGVGNAEVSASIFFDGNDASDNDVNFDTVNERIDAITTTWGFNQAPVVSATASDTGIEDTDKVYTHAQMLNLIGATDADDVAANLTINISSLVNGSLVMTGGTGGVGTTFTFTPDLDYVGDVKFDYQVLDDDNSASNVGTANITLSAVNDVPVASGNSVIATEDIPLVIGPGDFSFTDIEDDSLVSVSISSLNLNGGSLTHSGGTVNVSNGMTVTAAQLADLTFTPALNNTITSSFSYTVNDADNGSLSAAMNITVKAVNDAPVATGNTVIATEDIPLVIGPDDFNFSDVEGDSLVSVTISGLSLNGGTLTHSNGSVTVTNGMTITAAQLADLTFTSALNDSTNSSFDYTVNDAGLGTVSSTMYVTVNAVNDAPVATGNTVVATENIPLVIAVEDFLFSDVEGDALTSVLISGLNLNGGTLTHSGGSVNVTNGMTISASQMAGLTFTSALNDSTNSSFDYTVNDAGLGVVSSTMNINFNALNNVPVANGNTVVTSEDVPLMIAPGDFLYSDVENDTLVSVTISGLNLNGGTLTHTGGTVNVTNGMTITAAQLAGLTFTSALNDSSDSSFIYTVNDADKGTESASMSITVNAVNDAPLATGNTVIAIEDTPLLISPGDFNFTDIEGDSLSSVTITGLNLNGGTLTHTGGTVSVTNGMTITAAQLAGLTFTSALNDSTDSSFTYSVNDASTGSVSATMNITVNAVNDAPVATGNNVIATEDIPLVIGPGDFNFTDIEGDSLNSVTITGLNLNGGTLTHSSGTVSVTNGMTITAVQLADLTFTSAPNNTTTSSFTYTVNDADNGTVSAVMNITVKAVNDIPVATGSTVVALEDVPLLIGPGDFSFTDVEGDSLASVTISDLNLNGGTLTHTGGTVNVTNSMTITAAQLADLTFTSALNDSSNSSFDYTVNDGALGTVSSTMNITVNAVNDAPSLNNAIADQSATENSLFSFSFSANTFSDPDTADLTYSSSLSDGAALPAWLNFDAGTRTFSGTPVNADIGTVSIVVTADDGNGGAVASDTFNLVISKLNNSPEAFNLNSSVNYTEDDSSVDISDIVVLDTDTGVTITATLTLANTSTGSLSSNDGASYNVSTGVWTITDSVASVNTALANLTFTPEINNDLDTMISVVIDDADEDLSDPLTGTIVLDVTPTNDAPNASNIINETVITAGATSIPLTDIVISDVDTGEIVTATLILVNTSAGSLSVNDGASYDPVSGVWSMTGTVDTVNAALANLVFSPKPENPVSTEISVNIDDGDEDASGPILGLLKILSSTVTSASGLLDSTVFSVSELDGITADAKTPDDVSKEAATDEEVVEKEAENGVESDEAVAEEEKKFSPVEREEVDFNIILDAGNNVENKGVQIESNIQNPKLLKPKIESISIEHLKENFKAFGEPLQLIESESFLIKMNDLRDEFIEESKSTEKVLGNSLFVSAGLSVGYVVWLTRSGILLSSVLSTLPAWRLIDPLPILSSKNFSEDEDTESLESMVEEKNEQD